MKKYRLTFEFESDLPEDLVRKNILDIPDIEIDTESIEIYDEETIILTKEEYEELVACSNYIYNWGNRPVRCKRCGSLNPSHCICTSCGYDGSDED